MKRKRTKEWSGRQLHGHFKTEPEDLSGVSRNCIGTDELKKEEKRPFFGRARPGT